jgi:hypothetical protein
MANREQDQNQQNKGRQAPTTTSPDDDEAQLGDQSHAGSGMDSQHGRKRRQPDTLTDLGEEEVSDGGDMDDEDDDKEGISRS